MTFDDKLHAALSAEDEALLKEIGDEPGYFEQAFAMLDGKTAWVTWLILTVQGVMFIAGVWMAWNFFEANQVVTQLRWGLPSVTLLLLSAILKTSLMPVMQSNRILREIRRIELLRSRD